MVKGGGVSTGAANCGLMRMVKEDQKSGLMKGLRRKSKAQPEQQIVPSKIPGIYFGLLRVRERPQTTAMTTIVVCNISPLARSLVPIRGRDTLE